MQFWQFSLTLTVNGVYKGKCVCDFPHRFIAIVYYYWQWGKEMTNKRDMEKWKNCAQLQTKAFLCTSSRIVTFSWLNSHYVAKTSCKWSAKHLRFSMVTYQLTPWDKTIKHFVSSSGSGYLQYWQREEDPIFQMRKTKADQRSGTLAPTSSLAPASFLGLLGHHVARGSHRTTAVGLLFLSWFQDLQIQCKELHLCFITSKKKHTTMPDNSPLRPRHFLF